MKINSFWEKDSWMNAEAFYSQCVELIDVLQYSSREHVARINPSGRFQDSILRQIQHLVYLIEIAVSKKDQIAFEEDAGELCDFAEAVGLNIEPLKEQLEFIASTLNPNVTAKIFYDAPVIKKEISEILVISSARLISEIRRHPELLYTISPYAFEELVAEIFSKNGFSVEITGKTRDGGKDIIAVSKFLDIPIKYIIECKRYSLERKVSLDIVQRLYGVKFSQNANIGLVVTTSSFTKDAIQFASQHPWDLSLKDCDALLSWISG